MHILLLEDDRFLPEIFKSALEIANPDVIITHFRDSDSALEYVRAHYAEIKLYLLDIRVPGSMTGAQLAKHIRVIDPHTPMFITSAYSKPDDDLLTNLNSQWMAKPWHLLNASKLLLPLLINDSTSGDSPEPDEGDNISINTQKIPELSDIGPAPELFLAATKNVESVKDKISEESVYLFIASQSEPITIQGQQTIRLGRKNAQFDPTVDLSEYQGVALGVSRYHAEIIYKNNQYFIKDMGSTNGTWVNNQLIPSYRLMLLRDSDHIRLGYLSMIFYAVHP